MLLLRISRVGTGIRLVCLLKSLLQGLTYFLSAVRALLVVLLVVFIHANTVSMNKED